MNKKKQIRTKGIFDAKSDFIDYYLEKNTNHFQDAIKKTLAHGIFVVLGILVTNKMIHSVAGKSSTIKNMERYKIWFYVAIIVFVMYKLIRSRLMIIKSATERIKMDKVELSSTYKALAIAEEKVLSMAVDITDLKQAENKLHKRAYFDTLTGLPNRVWFEAEVVKRLSNRDLKNDKMALVYMDVDDFKYINDTLGHNTGDKMLQYIGDMLLNHIEKPNIIAHMSGDEFVILMVEILDIKDVISRIKEIQELLINPWVFDEKEFYISASMGIAIYPEQGSDLSTLLKNADTAMYYAKEQGKNGYSFFSKILGDKTLQYTYLVNELRKAIINDEFTLNYQPLVDLRIGKIIGVEALIRWKHPINGWISPDEFIPIAEASGLIIDIGNWVFKEACRQKRSWNDKGYNYIKMSINLSGRELTNRKLVLDLKEIIDTYDLEYWDIQVEITETAAMVDLNTSLSILRQLKNLGVMVALDDFGTGHSSLNYLKTLPIDTIKLDGSFIEVILDEEQEEEIITTVIQLGHILNMKVVAEGIETKEQFEFLRKHKCDVGQGYLFSLPLPAQEMESLFENNSDRLYDLFFE